MVAPRLAPITQSFSGNRQDISCTGKETVMSGTAVVLVHGRSQQMAPAARTGPDAEAAFVLALKRSWLAGLAKGLVLAGAPPIDPADVWFPYYGNLFADAVAAKERAHLPGPNVDAIAVAAAVAARPPSGDALILDAARAVGFTPERASAELSIPFGDLLKSQVLRAALAYLARKTGVPELVIERFLTDVGYYLDVPGIRQIVLDTVLTDIRAAAAGHDAVVLVTHSLGTIVGYDLFGTLGDTVDVPLFCTAGSPLGYPVVIRQLLPAQNGNRKRKGPLHAGAPIPWVNAFDVRDFVALIHPLADCYDARLRDEQTNNPSDPHSIVDYLADPDVAGPIGRSAAGQPPW